MQQIGRLGLQQSVSHMKACVDFGNGRRLREGAFVQVLQHDFIHDAHEFGAAIKPLHQLFAGSAAMGVAQAKLCGQVVLEIKQQPVFATPRQVVQTDAQHLQEALVTSDLPGFARRDQSVAGQRRPATAQTGTLADPEYALQVAQPAWTFLDVGFQIVGGIVEAGVAVRLFQ